MRVIKTCIYVIFILLTVISISQAAQVTLAWDAVIDPSVTGYKLYYGTSSRVYGAPVDVGKVTQATLTNIAEGQNIYFAVTAYSTTQESAYSIELPCFTLVPTLSGSGTIIPAQAVVVSTGMSKTFQMTPSTGYMIKDVLVDSTSVTGVQTYTFSNVTTNHSIKAIFDILPTTAITTGLKIIG